MAVTAYASLDQYKAAVGEARGRRMVPGVDGTAQDARISTMLMATSGRMDASLGIAYTLPLDTAGIPNESVKARCEAWLASICIALVGNEIEPGTDKAPGKFTDAAKAAGAWLDAVADRKAAIPGLLGDAIPTFAFVEGPLGSLRSERMQPFSPELFAIARLIGCYHNA